MERENEMTKESLCERYMNTFSIGAALDYASSKKYDAIISKHFNSVTPENDMKFAIIHPFEAIYEWDEMDHLVKYAKSRGCLIRGHTLIWHEQIPHWIREKANEPQQLCREMEKHISTIVDRYSKDIYCWDVVNEVISDGDELLRKTLWLDVIGEKYIDVAFLSAREAAPGSLLFLNEYNGHIPSKRKKITSAINAMRKRGIPIDGIGIQGHYNIYYPPIKMIRDEIEDYIENGLMIQITELDVSVYDYFDRRCDLKEPTLEMLIKQENMYYELFALYEEYKDHISGVTLWGVSDDHTWLDSFPVTSRKDWPLLFDECMDEKDVLKRLVRNK